MEHKAAEGGGDNRSAYTKNERGVKLQLTSCLQQNHTDKPLAFTRNCALQAKLSARPLLLARKCLVSPS